MITIANIRNAKPNEYDEIWAIVRSLKGNSSYLKQIQQLSPSINLFFKYRKWATEGQWNKEKFDNYYVPQFLKEIHGSIEARNKLNQLCRLDRENKQICLVCFCNNEEMCHRSIIAGLLQGAGYNVITEMNNDYSKYYQMYKNI